MTNIWLVLESSETYIRSIAGIYNNHEAALDATYALNSQKKSGIEPFSIEKWELQSEDEYSK